VVRTSTCCASPSAYVRSAGVSLNGNVTVKLDGGGTLQLRAHRVVRWEAHLVAVMPAVEHNPVPEQRAPPG
jgi:hypothetical protein